MRIALHVDGIEFRGAERQALLIANGLRERGHRVAVSCRSRGPVREAFADAGHHVTGLRPRGDADLVSMAGFTAWLRMQRPDAVLLTSWVRLFGASLAARASGAPRVVQRVGGVQTVPARGPSGWKYRRALTRQIDLLVVNSPGLAESFREQLPDLPPSHVRVVPNAVDFTPAPPAPLRAELGLDEDDVLLLGAGGLERRKGFDLLIEALPRVFYNQHVHILLAGSGPEEANLRAQAQRLGLGGRVHFLGQRRDLPAVFAAVDALVLSSRGDSLANVMLEAMAAGLPVLATDVPGSEQALAATAGRQPAGWIVARRDVAALAMGMQRLLRTLRKDPAVARARVDEAHWRVRNWFGPEAMVDGYEAALAGREPAR
jgi:glycosyltransferase involved in cell wall biosynthesis